MSATRDHEREEKLLSEIMLTRSAAEWEAWLQERHVPASRVRTMGEALADPQIASRGVLHRQDERAGRRRRRSPSRWQRSSSRMTARASIAPPPMFGAAYRRGAGRTGL